MRPHVMEWDEAQHFPMDLLPKLAALGLMGIQFDEQYGGSAMSAVDYCICIEELARVCPAIALSVAAHNGLCTAHINMFGNDAQKQHYLPRLVQGEVLGAWGLTEASAGSDAAGMRTTATQQGDCWVLNGSKSFITHGKIGGVMVAMAVTDRDEGPPRHLGVRARARHAGDERGQEREQARHARQRHERGGVPGLPAAGGAAARRGGAGLHQHAAGPRRRPHRHRGALGRPRAGRLRGGAQVREGAPAVRPADRRVPGDPVEARRRGDADRSRAAAHLPRRLPEGPRPRG